jgi:pimeloyl-ACP methyl ester carboxylesterase
MGKAARNPRELLESAFDLTSTGDPANRAAWMDAVLQADGGIEQFQDILLSLTPPSSRGSGLENDLLQTLSSFRELKTPVLLIYGGMDKAVPLGKTEKGRFAPAELLLLPEAGHLLLLGSGAPTAAKRMVDFLNLHSPKSVSGKSNDGE